MKEDSVSRPGPRPDHLCADAEERSHPTELPKPLGRLLPASSKPAWKEIDDLFHLNRLAPPPTRLRDDLVTLLLWARYGQAIADANQ